MRKSIRFIALVVTIFMVFCLCMSSLAEEEIVIGLAAMQTGSLSQVGAMQTYGLQMAINEVNAAGGVNGEKVAIRIEDTASDPDMAINAMNKFGADDSISLSIGFQLSSLIIGCDSAISKSSLPTIATGSSLAIYDLDNPYIFRGRASDTIAAAIAAKYLVEELGATNVGILYCTDVFGTGGYTVASEYYDSIGIPYTAESHNVDDADMSSQVMKIMQAGCDGVLIWTSNAPYVILARNIYELGFEVPVMTNPSLSDGGVIALCEEEWLESWYAVSDYAADNPDADLVDFGTRFEDLYGVPADSVAAVYYSLGHMICDAFARAEDPHNREAVREALASTDYEGVVTHYVCDNVRDLVHSINIITMNEGLQYGYVGTYTTD